jgi:Transmembrane domain of unknown function (DUF3566)
MPADAPRATADDRLASAESADGEAAPSDALPATRPPNGNGGPAAPSGDASAAIPAPGANGGTTVDDDDNDDDGQFAALLAEVEGRAPLDSGGSVDHANGGFPDPDPSLRQTSPGPAPFLRGDPGADPTVVGDGIPPAPGLAGGPDGAGAPGARRSRRRLTGGRGREGRRIRQRLWAIDPWSVFKISVMFYACMFVVVLVAGTVLWNVGRSSGVIDEFEGFVTQLGAYGECVAEEEVAAGTEFVSDDDCPDGTVRVDSFVLDDGVVFKSTLIAAAVIAITGSAANVLMVVLLNLITEVSGGLKYTIIREPTSPKRRRGVMKRLSGSLPSAEKR